MEQVYDKTTSLVIPGKPVVIFDLDGTLSDYSHRLDIVDIDEFRKAGEFDAPLPSMVTLAYALARHNNIAIVTARSTASKIPTMKWLNKHFTLWSWLFMRTGDVTDPNYKEQVLLDGLKGENVVLAIDDKKSVCEMYAKYTQTLQVYNDVEPR